MTPWQPGWIPALFSWPEDTLQLVVVENASDLNTIDDVYRVIFQGDKMQVFSLWKNGKRLRDGDFALQCGSFLSLVLSQGRPSTYKVGEEDLVEPPTFDIDHEEEVVPPEAVRGRDDAIVLMRDDEEIILAALANMEEENTVHLILFGHDGHFVGRRDAEANPANFEGIQRAIEASWNDYEGHLLKATLVQPQPLELAREGLVFVVALQHIFAGEPVPPDGSILCLIGLQLSYAGATEPEIHRAVALEEMVDAAEIRLRMQLNSICQPHGRRECSYSFGMRPLIEGDEVMGQTGSYAAVSIGAERQPFDLRRACRDVDSILQDIERAVQDERIQQVHLVQHGYRYRPIGRVTQTWTHDAVIDDVSLAQSFAAGWLSQPLARMQIHRARALDVVRGNMGVLELHFLLSFDLVPGYAICLMVNPTDGMWSMAGPHLLQPQYWSADGLSDEVANPLRENNYEILLYPGRLPTLLAQSGDVVQYVHEDATRTEDGVDAEGDGQTSHIQMSVRKLSSLFEPESRSTSRVVSGAYDSQLSNYVKEVNRADLQLFPHLEDSLPFDIGLPVPEPTVEEFLHACRMIQIAKTIPAESFDALKPISKAFIETCEPLQETSEVYHVYTDGSACTQFIEGHAYREASWAAAIFRVSGRRRAFHGWLGGLVQTDPKAKCFIGAEAKNAMDAERSAVFWILAWCLSLPNNSEVIIHVDNQAACYGASGAWKISLDNVLAVRIRELAAYAETQCKIIYEHVKAHSLQPQNELVDVLAGLVAEDTRCIPHRNSTSDCRVAAFKDYKRLWFWHQGGKALPSLNEKDQVQDEILADPKSAPNLFREAETCDCTASRAVMMNMHIATYNVLTLKPFEKPETSDAESSYFGKAAYLQKQMVDCGLCALAVQEGRSRTSGLFENAQAIRVVAAGTLQGTHGVELWLSKHQSIGQCGRQRLYFEKNMITVRVSKPTLLIVNLNVGKKRLVFVICHAPQTGQEDEKRSEWWRELDEEVGKISMDDVLLVMGDLNARLPCSLEPWIGDLVCAKSNGNTSHLVDLLQKRQLCAPSTFSALHHGPIETWQHSSGQQSRLDYCLVRSEQWSNVASSAWPRLDAGNAVADHFAVALQVRAEWYGQAQKKKTGAIDWGQIRESGNHAKVCELLSGIQVGPWSMHPTDQVYALTKEIRGKLSEAFPLKGARFRKPYMSDAIWRLRKRRCNLRALLRSVNRIQGRHLQELWWGFRRWKRAKCSSTGSSFVIPNLVIHMSIQTLRSTAREMKAGLQQERAAYVTEISSRANSSNTGQIFMELKKLGVNSRTRKSGPTPLPMWCDAQGSPAEDQQQRADIWRERCSDLEAGAITTTEELLSRAEGRRRLRGQDLEAPHLSELPSLTHIEAKLRAVKKNKASGNDLLRSELCSIGAAPLAKHVHALASKFVVFLEEPLQWKGGSLIAAYKQAGRMDDVKSYRSLLLSDHLGKSMRSWLREKFRSIYSQHSAETHFAGKLGGNPSHASSMARAFF